MTLPENKPVQTLLVNLSINKRKNNENNNKSTH